MKSASGALIALLNSQQFLMADLLTITTIGGAIYRYTSADVDLSVGGNLFSASGVRFKRGTTRTVIGIEVDTLDLTLYASATDMLGALPILAALNNGGLDGAAVKLERVFMATFGDTSAGTVVLFAGRVAECQFGRTEARLSVKSDLEILNIKMPRNLYAPNCIHTLFDAGCGLSKGGFGVAGTTIAGGTKTVIPCSLIQAAGYFDQGTITFTSGANAGVTRNIKSYAVGSVTLNYPLSNAPGIGDAFTAWPGCDKTQATCAAKFGNLANFRGFPYIPTPETAL